MQDRKDNSGALFKNDDTKPVPYGGSSDTVCPHCNAKTAWWLSGWVREMKDGRKYFSLSFKAKDAKPEPRQKEWKDELSDEIPF